MVKLLRDADVEVKFNEIGVQKLSAIRKDFDRTFGNFDTLHLIYCRHLQTFAMIQGVQKLKLFLFEVLENIVRLYVLYSDDGFS